MNTSKFTASDNCNTLVIDNDCNSSIAYQKSAIDNKFEHLPEFDELLEIFEDRPEDIFKYDTRNCFSLILKDGSEKTLNEFKNDDYIEFFKITDEKLRKNNCEILVPSVQTIGMNIRWHKNDYVDRKATRIAPFICDTLWKRITEEFDGYANWQELLIKDKDIFDGEETIDSCFNRHIKINEIVYQSYLPSAYQMKLIFDFMPVIRYINQKSGINIYSNFNTYNFWTSNYVDEHCICIVGRYFNDTKTGDYFIYGISRHEVCSVFPIYKKIVKD